MLVVAVWICAPDRKDANWARCIAAVASAGLGYGSYMFIGKLPDWLVFPIGAAAITATVALGGCVLLNFKKPTIAQNWWIPLTVGAGLVVLLLAETPKSRAIAESVWFTGLLLYISFRVAVVNDASPLPGYRLVVFGGVGGAVCAALRAVVELGTDAQGIIDSASWHVWLTFLAGYVVGNTWTIAYIMLQKERAESQVRDMAMTDPLTGIYNRRMLYELAELEFKRARLTKARVAVLMIDIDHSKNVNDTHGHLIGDQVLKHVAGVIGSCLREEDLFVRFGGEEFCVLVASAKEVGVKELAERIRCAVHSAAFSLAGAPLPLSVSIGVSSVVPDASHTMQHLLAHADKAVYQAKRDGRNQVSALAV